MTLIQTTNLTLVFLFYILHKWGQKMSLINWALPSSGFTLLKMTNDKLVKEIILLKKTIVELKNDNESFKFDKEKQAEGRVENH